MNTDNNLNNMNNVNNINNSIGTHAGIPSEMNIAPVYPSNMNTTGSMNNTNQSYMNNSETIRPDMSAYISKESYNGYREAEERLKEAKRLKDEKANAKRKATARKIAASVAAIAICGTSIGIGAGIGSGVMTKIGFGENGARDFSFGEDTVATLTTNNSDSAELMSTNTIAPIIKDVKDAVVNINVIAEKRDFFNQVYQSTGAGSGIMYKDGGDKIYIITNNHVVDGANKVTISVTGEEQVSATLVGKDAQSDLAVISVLKSDLAEAGITDPKIAKFANSDYIEVGEYVIAIGNAMGTGKTVTQGIISAQNKNITIDGKKLVVLQTDAAINPGNSGGALVNTDGEVIGINTAKISSTTIEGMGYAIPSSIAVSIADELISNGSIERPYLGVEVFTINDTFKMMYNIDIDGVFISSVNKGSTAEEAGLQSTDIIVGLIDVTIKTAEDLSTAIKSHNANEEITLHIIRNGITPMDVNVKLAVAQKSF